ncbi:meckelin-like [Acropora millepora]|uniref:meckelin-like n=1 Tax=Acropora millepora TaxID=45264 RepID=UPI001CF2B447|nr:meckelin-like [Acropora millepora]
MQVKMAAPLASPSRSIEKRLLAYNTLNLFLSAFIDHSLRDLDYLVRDKLLLEHILNMELKDQPPSDKATSYHDNGRSFNSVLLYGREWTVTLMLFDLLMFAFFDSLAQDFVLAGVVTYLVAKILIIFRNKFGRKNITIKTRVDERSLI